MNNKIKLLEVANKKAAEDPAFIAYFLNKFMTIENTSELAIIQLLNCSTESFYKLGLCQAPNVNLPDYLNRINTICSYVGISAIELNKIIKRVNSVTQLTGSSTNDISYLMAARDKKKKDK
ncbi:MAG: hypothetical protein ACJ748_08605 [Flavisolibacter sp.]